MALNKGMFTSNTDMWETPQDFFNVLNNKFNFELDVCAVEENAKCDNYFSPEDDGLAQDWKGQVCWMNPPYGREISKWVKKAYNEYTKGATVVCLLPSRTDTRYIHDYVFQHAKYIGFIKGRLKFGNSNNSAPFPSLVAIFTDSEYDLSDIDLRCKWVQLK